MFKSAQAYSKMLELQADITFKYECNLFADEYWKSSKCVADIGCGNGYFTSLLADQFPDKKFVALEPNRELYCIAVQDYARPNITYQQKPYSEYQADKKFDFIIARLVINQLADRLSFIKWAKKSLNSNGALLIIDADDENFSVYPTLTLFSEIEDKTKAHLTSIGGRRDTKQLIVGEALSQGFVQNRFLTLSPNTISTDKSLFYRYMLYTIKFREGEDLSPMAYKELFEWFDNPGSFAQYGLYIALFIKGDLN